MKIIKIEIQDFRGLSEVSIDNLNPYLNLLIGVNGAGKSSILDAIVLLLSDFTSRLTTSKGKGLKIKYDDIKRNSRRGCSLSITLDNRVEWTKGKSGKLNSKEGGDYSRLNSYTNNLRDDIDHYENVNLPIIVHYGVKRSVTDIPLKFPKEILQSNATYKDWVDSKASYRDIFPWLRGEEDYENELIRDNSGTRVRGLEALRKALTTIFSEYTDLRVRRKPRLDVVLRKRGEELSLSQLSDGEKCYIALVLDIVRRLTIANPTGDILSGEGIVLIDEVDLHLHPSWEATVMEKLHQAFPNIQFIVSAHSPLVASHFDGQVYTVNCGNVERLPRLFGLDYSEILQDFMGIRPDNREVNSLVDMYNTYKRHGMTPQAEAVRNKLVQLMDGDMSAPVFAKLKN